MQTPAQRKDLIRAGLYDQLEAPENIGFGAQLGFTRSPQQLPRTVREVFGSEKAIVAEREPGEDG